MRAPSFSDAPPPRSGVMLFHASTSRIHTEIRAVRSALASTTVSGPSSSVSAGHPLLKAREVAYYLTAPRSVRRAPWPVPGTGHLQGNPLCPAADARPTPDQRPPRAHGLVGVPCHGVAAARRANRPDRPAARPFGAVRRPGRDRGARPRPRGVASARAPTQINRVRRQPLTVTAVDQAGCRAGPVGPD